MPELLIHWRQPNQIYVGSRSLYFILALVLITKSFADFKISEFLASNENGLSDEDSDHSDWIEITNTKNETSNIGGWHLTDDKSNKKKWILPPIDIAPQETIIVFASGKNRNQDNSELHTNFSLDSNGEYLALVKPDGETITSEYIFPMQETNVSYGYTQNPINEIIVSSNTPLEWLIPSSPIEEWTSNDFNSTQWNKGAFGVGFDTSDDYDPFFETDVKDAMRGIQTSIYLRTQFEIADPDSILKVELTMQYEDGFVVWINNQLTASRNAPESIEWNSRATSNRPDSQAVQKTNINLEFDLGNFQEGTNTLAIQGLNRSPIGSDFLISPELIITKRANEEELNIGYFLEPTPGQVNNNSVLGFVKDTKFSVRRGFYEEPFELVISSSTPDSIIKYTTDGSTPSEDIGMIYTKPINIEKSTTIRAIALKQGHQPTNIDTQTYLFVNDIKDQTLMDNDVLNDIRYSDIIDESLTGNLSVMSITVDDDQFFGPFGIHSNPELSGRDAEVPISLEYFSTENIKEQFQIDAGLRIHGGNARDHPKKPFRLYFRELYGEKRLRFDLFKDSPVSSFDQLILRSGGHDSWSLADGFGRNEVLDIPAHGTLMRDQFLRKTETEMDMLSPRGKYIHLYINNQYWGVYDLHERPNAAFFESHMGGDESDYDVIHHPTFFGESYTMVDGDPIAWETARNIVNRGIVSENDYNTISNLVDIDNLIDHFIVRTWSGDYDWLSPIERNGADVSVFDNKNWYSGRRSRGEKGKFKFFTWDAEMSMGNHLMINLIQFAIPAQGIINFDLTGVNDPGSPAEFYSKLQTYRPFKVRFGDRIHKHLYNNGKMTTDNNKKRWNSLSSTLENAIIAESARWGDEGTFSPEPFTKDDHWLPEVEWVKDEFIQQRNRILVNQFRDKGLYPEIDAPIFNQFGGNVPDNFLLIMNANDSDIYYTIDGSDPYIPKESDSTALVDSFTELHALVPSVENGGADLGLEWIDIEEPENLQEWSYGESGIGYERSGSNYRPFINLDVEEMANTNPSVFIRIPFTISNELKIGSISELKLLMRYDDGFVAYLNGVRVASSNAFQEVFWNSPSNGNRSDSLAIVPEEFDISQYKDLLIDGENILAIQALNDSSQSSDLLCIPELVAISNSFDEDLSPDAIKYSASLTLTNDTVINARSYSNETNEWSALASSEFIVGNPATKENLIISEFNYHPQEIIETDIIKSEFGQNDFEFIELTNIADYAIRLRGVEFSQGIDFKFDQDSEFKILQPGQQILIVKNTDAMISRYGNSVKQHIAGEFKNETKLSNNGEKITLIGNNKQVIHSINYSDDPPWPVGSDGEGFTNILKDLDNNIDISNPENWTTSNLLKGSPAGIKTDALSYNDWKVLYFSDENDQFESLSSPESDPDEDGFMNASEYAFGTSPTNSIDRPIFDYNLIKSNDNDYLGITFRASAKASDVVITGETSNSLLNWLENTTIHSISLSEDKAHKIMTVRSNLIFGKEKRHQMRLKTTLLLGD